MENIKEESPSCTEKKEDACSSWNDPYLDYKNAIVRIADDCMSRVKITSINKFAIMCSHLTLAITTLPRPNVIEKRSRNPLCSGFMNAVYPFVLPDFESLSVVVKLVNSLGYTEFEYCVNCSKHVEDVACNGAVVEAHSVRDRLDSFKQALADLKSKNDALADTNNELVMKLDKLTKHYKSLSAKHSHAKVRLMSDYETTISNLHGRCSSLAKKLETESRWSAKDSLVDDIEWYRSADRIDIGEYWSALQNSHAKARFVAMNCSQCHTVAEIEDLVNRYFVKRVLYTMLASDIAFANFRKLENSDWPDILDCVSKNHISNPEGIRLFIEFYKSHLSEGLSFGNMSDDFEKYKDAKFKEAVGTPVVP